jgi:hypothetical protein
MTLLSTPPLQLYSGCARVTLPAARRGRLAVAAGEVFAGPDLRCGGEVPE